MALLKGCIDEITIPLTAELDASGGKPLIVKFDATFTVLKFSESQEVLKAIMNRDDSGEPSDETLIRRYLRGWNMPGAGGGKAEFCAEALDEALEVRGYRDALMAGVMEMLLGHKFIEARRKN